MRGRAPPAARTLCRPAGAPGPRPPCWRRRCRSIPAALPVRTEDVAPPSWPHPPSAPCTDASHRAPLSIAVDTGAGADAVFSSGVVRWVCAQTAPPATTDTDMTTASSLIWSPFADSCASRWTMPSRQWLSRDTRRRATAKLLPWHHTVKCDGWVPTRKDTAAGTMFRSPAPRNTQNEWTRESCTPPDPVRSSMRHRPKLVLRTSS